MAVRATPRRTREEVRKSIKEVVKRMNFKDQNRVKDDATNALMQYQFLRPSEDEVRSHSGSTARSLKLAGTVGMKFKDKEYFIPCAVHLTEDYPKRGPIAYIVPTPNMVIKQQHMHVDAQTGLCYLPYLHDWNKKTSSIVGCIESLSEVFSRDPFLYSKPAQAPAPAPAPAPAAAFGKPPYGAYQTPYPPAIPAPMGGIPPYMTGGMNPPYPPYGTGAMGGLAAMGGVTPGVASPSPSPMISAAAAAAAASVDVDNEKDPEKLRNKVHELQAKLEEEKSCSVCFTLPKDALFVPCGHVAVCNACAQALQQRSQPCPICRQPIQQIFKAFVV